MKAIPEKSIAHYQILEPLGAGGMGEVYKAYDEKLHRVVALKLLQPEYISQQDRRRRFLQEVPAASALNHPHIMVSRFLEPIPPTILPHASLSGGE